MLLALSETFFFLPILCAHALPLKYWLLFPLQSFKVEASILVKISNCSYLETRFSLTKNIQRKQN
jgi:hypothetical protein